MTPITDLHVCDSEAARLLPWFATGRIDAEDAARVEAHVSSCPVCRADLAAQRELHGLMQAGDKVEYSPQPSLQKLMSRIDELDREIAPAAATPVVSAAASSAPPPVRTGLPRWLVAAVVLQTIGLGTLGTLLWQHAGGRSAGAEYVTLGSVAADLGPAPRVRVVFAPDTTIGGMAALLGAVRADIVAGPTEAGAYTLALRPDSDAPASVDSGLARLRADPHVVFAEPVVTGAGPPR
jgi:anti-sigma factor RsiW